MGSILAFLLIIALFVFIYMMFRNSNQDDCDCESLKEDVCTIAMLLSGVIPAGSPARECLTEIMERLEI